MVFKMKKSTKKGRSFEYVAYYINNVKTICARRNLEANTHLIRSDFNVKITKIIFEFIEYSFLFGMRL